MDHKNLCQMILLEMSLCILYGMLCGLATAVAVLNYGTNYSIAGYMGVTHKKICCPSAAVKLKLPSQIIASKLLYFLLHFNYSQ